MVLPKLRMKQTHKSCFTENKKARFEKIEQKSQIFDGFVFHIFPSRFGPQRVKVFESQILNHGGKICSIETENKDDITHVVLEETIDTNFLLNICCVKDFKNSKFVSCSWLVNSLKNKECIPLNEDFVLYENLSNQNKPKETYYSYQPGPSTVSKNESYSDPKQENKFRVIKENATEKQLCLQGPSEIIGQGYQGKVKPSITKFAEKFACAHSSNILSTNFNEHITTELEKLLSAYECRKDTWRAVGYQKAISAIKNHPHKIKSWEEAKSIRGVGDRLADKIKEIIECGELRKVKEVYENEETKTLEMFLGIWGAGPTTANSWYTQGFRTLGDLRTKANLTRHQQIGLKYYEELNERMPRSEVYEIGEEVRVAAEAVKKGSEVTVCGSYRRGKDTCGDVDVLVTHPDGVSHENIFKALLEKLREREFITDDLVIQENGNQYKYLGVCKLPGDERKHRRLDIIVVPYKEYAPAFLYFTGSAHFNRSMRLLATKLGMSLSEHGLRTGIVRDGKSAVSGGTLLDTPTEESVFEHLGLPYRAPNERNH